MDRDKEIQKVWNRLRRYGIVSGEMPELGYEWGLNCADLRGKDLSGLYLYHFNLERALLVGTNLERCFLNTGELRGANLSKANLTKASLWNANLSECDLTYAILDGANLSGASLKKADLTRASLANADLRETNFAQARLVEANCVNADMYGADFRHANISGADFRGADISRIKLEGAQTVGLLLENARPKKKYIVPGCHMCGRGNTPQWYYNEEKFRKFGLSVGDRVGRCHYCGASMSFGDNVRVEVVGTNGSEVAKVIKEVQKMNSQEKIVVKKSLESDYPRPQAGAFRPIHGYATAISF
jgi:hypothetical protein